MITQEKLKELFDYHPDGYLINRVRRGRTALAGKRTCREKVKSYRQVAINGKPVREHILIWIWHYGTQPDTIDHIDFDRLNNKIENLRSVTHQQNIRHGSGRQAGITYPKGKKKPHVKITVNDKSIHVGVFNTYEEALEARLKAERIYWWANA